MGGDGWVVRGRDAGRCGLSGSAARTSRTSTAPLAPDRAAAGPDARGVPGRPRPLSAAAGHRGACRPGRRRPDDRRRCWPAGRAPKLRRGGAGLRLAAMALRNSTGASAASTPNLFRFLTDGGLRCHAAVSPPRPSEPIRHLQGPILVLGASGFVGANLLRSLPVRQDVYGTTTRKPAWRLEDLPVPRSGRPTCSSTPTSTPC